MRAYFKLTRPTIPRVHEPLARLLESLRWWAVQRVWGRIRNMKRRDRNHLFNMLMLPVDKWKNKQTNKQTAIGSHSDGCTSQQKSQPLSRNHSIENHKQFVRCLKLSDGVLLLINYKLTEMHKICCRSVIAFVYLLPLNVIFIESLLYTVRRDA